MPVACHVTTVSLACTNDRHHFFLPRKSTRAVLSVLFLPRYWMIFVRTRPTARGRRTEEPPTCPMGIRVSYSPAATAAVSRCSVEYLCSTVTSKGKHCPGNASEPRRFVTTPEPNQFWQRCGRGSWPRKATAVVYPPPFYTWWIVFKRLLGSVDLQSASSTRGERERAREKRMHMCWGKYFRTPLLQRVKRSTLSATSAENGVTRSAGPLR